MAKEKSPQLPSKRRRRRILLIGLAVVGVAAYFISPSVLDNPQDYEDIEAHFKYGSIGSEQANGIPYWIWKALPELFADKLPGKGYASLGFIQEDGMDRPVGFSVRRLGVDRVSLNCGVCHTGSVRDSATAPPRIITGMPANTMNLEKYSRFLIEVANDERFTTDLVMEAIEKVGGDLGIVGRLIYRNLAIPQTKAGLVDVAKRLSFLDRQPPWGPGRVDTFSPYKALQFNYPMDKLDESEIVGIVDLPSIWMQRPREGMQLHWDGNNSSVQERNKSAALGAGVTPTSIDLPRIKRIEDWLLDVTPPAYPYPIDQALAAKGKPVYDQHCASCHGVNGRDFSGPFVGKVEPIDKIKTDRHRLDSYTYDLLSNQSGLYAGYEWRFKQFRKTNGYANMPLDGVWLRAPYLHNGSVPNLRALMEAPEDRPKVFYRGNDVFDPKNVGFVSDVAERDGLKFFEFNTSERGNSQSGHIYGVSLPASDKDAVVEYLKTF